MSLRRADVSRNGCPASSRRCRGLTLLELAAAFGLSGMLLLGVRSLLDSLAATREQLARESIQEDAVRNGERLFATLVRRIGSAANDTGRVVADERAMDLPTWCDAPGGWLERCRVRFLIFRVGAESHVVAMRRQTDSLLLVRLPGDAQFRYYDPALIDQGWVSTWGSTIAVPAAIAVVSQSDTVVVGTGRAR